MARVFLGQLGGTCCEEEGTTLNTLYWASTGVDTLSQLQGKISVAQRSRSRRRRNGLTSELDGTASLSVHGSTLLLTSLP